MKTSTRNETAKQRLEYLRGELRAERISYGLIAAAPELLEACKQSIITLDPMDKDHVELYRTLRAAIAKATGK